MYCSKCGMENSDNSHYCSMCGAKLSTKNESVAEESMVSEDNSILPSDMECRKGISLLGISASKKIVIILAATALLVLVTILATGRSWKATVNGYMNALIKGEITQLWEFSPKEETRSYLEKNGLSRKEYLAQVDDACAESIGVLSIRLSHHYDTTLDEYLRGLSFEIIDHSKCAKEEISTKNEQYRKYYGTKKDIIKDAMIVKILFSAELNHEESAVLIMYLVKIGNSWYVDYDGGAKAAVLVPWEYW